MMGSKHRISFRHTDRSRVSHTPVKGARYTAVMYLYVMCNMVDREQLRACFAASLPQREMCRLREIAFLRLQARGMVVSFLWMKRWHTNTLWTTRKIKRQFSRCSKGDNYSAESRRRLVAFLHKSLIFVLQAQACTVVLYRVHRYLFRSSRLFFPLSSLPVFKTNSP